MDNPQEALLKIMLDHFAQLFAQLSIQLTTHIDNRLTQSETRLNSMDRSPRSPFKHEPEAQLSSLPNLWRVQQPDPYQDLNPKIGRAHV